MSASNLNSNLIQPQNIVLNQVPIQHAVTANANNNGIPMSALSDQTGGHLKSGIVVETIPMMGVQSMSTPIKTTSLGEQSQVLSKQRLQDLVRETDPTLNLEDEVEEIILNYVDEFVDRCLNGAALIAKNRNVSTIEVKDVQQFLNRNYNMWTPGLGTDELRPYKRSLTTEAHKHRLALIRKTLKKY